MVVRKKVYFLGGGNMAKAIISAISDDDQFEIVVVDRNQEKRILLQQQFGIRVEEKVEYLTKDDILLVAVKPKDVEKACLSIVTNGCLIISIVSGLSINQLSHFFRGNNRIIRVMPNTPAQIKKGMSGLFANHFVSSEDKSIVEKIFAKTGDYIWVDVEDKLHGITAISGSGPAYVFYLLDSLFESARKLGFEEEVSKQLVLSTFHGAVSLAQLSGKNFSTLRQEVSSKGGTTVEAIKIFEDNDLSRIIYEGVLACKNRSIEISKENDGI